MSELPAACLAIEAELSALLDEELETAREAEVRAHVERCDRCTRRLEELCNADLALASLAAPRVPDDLAQRLAARLAGPPAAAPVARIRSPERARRWAPLRTGVGLAAAAAVLLVVWVSLRGGGPEESTPPLARSTPASEPAAAPRAAPAPERLLDEAPAEAVAELPPQPAPAVAPEFEGLGEEDLALLLAARQLEDLAVIENLEVLEALVGLGLGEGAG